MRYYILTVMMILVSVSCERHGYTGGYKGKSTSIISSDAKEYRGMLKMEYLGDPFRNGQAGAKANAYRIPAILLITNGTILITADIRYGAPADSAHNIDSGIRRSTDHGHHWSPLAYIQKFDDFQATNITETTGGNYSSVSCSASFIDPAIVQTEKGDILTITTTFPWNSGLMGSNKGRGVIGLASYTNISGKIYLRLRGKTNNPNDSKVGNNATNEDKKESEYKYRVAVGGGNITKMDGSEITEAEFKGYSVDTNWFLYKGISNNNKTNYVMTTQYTKGRNSDTKQKNGTVKVTNHLFYVNSPFHPVPTSYIFMARSTNDGKSFGLPVDITWQFDGGKGWNNNPKNSGALKGKAFTGVSPGVGYTVREGAFKGRTLIALQPALPGTCAATSIYSSDNGATWTVGESVDIRKGTDKDKNKRLSESQYIEAPEGQLILVHRRNSVITYSQSKDGGHSWAGLVSTDIPNAPEEAGVMVGAVNVTRTKYYNKAMFAISVATGQTTDGKGDKKRNNGRIYLGYIEKNPSTGLYELKFEIDGKKQFQAIGAPNEKFAYSSLAELGDGTIGLLYEGKGYGGGGTGQSYISFAKLHLKR